MDFTGFEQALAAAAGAVLARIGQHHTLPQRCDEDVLTFPNKERFFVSGDRDFELLHVFLPGKRDIFTDYALLW